jgi:hypothetical protein
MDLHVAVTVLDVSHSRFTLIGQVSQYFYRASDRRIEHIESPKLLLFRLWQIMSMPGINLQKSTQPSIAGSGVQIFAQQLADCGDCWRTLNSGSSQFWLKRTKTDFI